MTRRKAFKARVRSRMEQTGQSYAQAAAALEASNPRGTPDVHPASAQVVGLLRTGGAELAPELAYGIGGGIGFMYAVFVYEQVDHPLLTLVCQHHPEPWAPAILDRLAVPYTATTRTAELRALLGDRVPMILGLGARPGQHEDEERVVLAAPTGDGWRVTDGVRAAVLSEAELLGGWRRKHPVVHLDRPVTLPADLGPAVRAGLAQSVAHLTGPVLGNAFDVNFGLSGLAKWRDVANGTTKSGWPRLFAGTDVWMQRLVDCIEHQHTAPAAGRPLFARTLHAAGIPDAAATFVRSGRMWREISGRAASRRLRLDWLADQVGMIHDAEAAGVQQLAAALRGEAR
jgi:hypothetical protein